MVFHSRAGAGSGIEGGVGDMREPKPGRCESCSRGEFTNTLLEQKQHVAGFIFTVTLRARECPACRAREIDGADLERFDLGVARALAMSGVVNGEAFRFMRESIGFERERAADALGSSESCLAAWESGRGDPPSEAMASLARIVLERSVDPSVPRVTVRPLGRARRDSEARKTHCA